jgi:hypothetical protein
VKQGASHSYQRTHPLPRGGTDLMGPPKSFSQATGAFNKAEALEKQLCIDKAASAQVDGDMQTSPRK